MPAILCKATVGDDAPGAGDGERCRAELGGLDVLVNNAGMTHFIPHTDLEAVTDAVWDEIFQVNLKGAVLRQPGRDAAVEGAAGLHRQRLVGGRLARDTAARSHTRPARRRMNCMTQSLARAFAPDVRVNAVAPGPIQTRWLKGHEDTSSKAMAQTPLRRAADAGRRRGRRSCSWRWDGTDDWAGAGGGRRADDVNRGQE